ncbi:cuticle protein 8-like [Macrobrachium rosenbergii]|uniref:cuticle protein 8-like n=1 Tax=Macrobrachium rosenbergii TaxID=79674 RepID=UPI0034D4786D
MTYLLFSPGPSFPFLPLCLTPPPPPPPSSDHMQGCASCMLGCFGLLQSTFVSTPTSTYLQSTPACLPTPVPTYAPPQPLYRPPAPSTDPQPTYDDGSSEEKEKGEPYEFEYSVEDPYKGLEFGHNSESDGNVVTGEYHVLLPDGRTQTVSYTADHYNGYQAEVTYEGEAQYPEPQQYAPPQQQYSQPPQQQYSQPPQQQYSQPPQQQYSQPPKQQYSKPPRPRYQKPKPQKPRNRYQPPTPTYG